MQRWPLPVALVPKLLALGMVCSIVEALCLEDALEVVGQRRMRPAGLVLQAAAVPMEMAPGCEQPLAMLPGVWGCWPAGLVLQAVEVVPMDMAPGCEQPVAMPPGLWACWPAGLLPKPAEVEQLELLPPGCEGLLVLLPLVSGQLGAVVGRVGSAAAAVAPALGLVAFAAAAFAVDCLALVAAFHLMACLHLACSLKL